MLGTKLVTYFMRDIVYVKRVTDWINEAGNAMCLSCPVETTGIVTNRTDPGETAFDGLSTTQVRPSQSGQGPHRGELPDTPGGRGFDLVRYGTTGPDSE